jgi:hypothetical protein
MEQRLKAVEEATAALRSSRLPSWQCIAQTLMDHGRDPADAAVAARWSEDETEDWGVLVCRDGVIIEFGVKPRRDAPARVTASSDVAITGWVEHGRDSPLPADLEIFREDIQAATLLLQATQQEGGTPES